MMSVFIRAKQNNIWLLISYIFFAVPVVVFLSLLIFILIHVACGFDITDESYYLLWASQPERVLASFYQFGYYTKLLYVLSFENIAIFRTVGILFLLSITLLFSIALDRYWASFFSSVGCVKLRTVSIILILAGALTYYRGFQLTPSYNWLSLASVLLCSTGLLRLTTINTDNGTHCSTKRGIILNALIVGCGGAMAFMAKPTTAFILVFVTLFWVAIHPVRSKWKIFLGVSSLTAFLFLLIHSFVFYGGIVPFYVVLSEGVEDIKVLGAGHTTISIFTRTIDDIKKVFFHSLSLISGWLLFAPVVVVVSVWWNKKFDKVNIARVVVLLFITSFFLTVCYQLLKTGQWSRTGMGFSGIAMWISLLISAVLIKIVCNSGKFVDGEGISFLRILGLCIFILLLAVSYAFGSGNGLVRQMSGAYVFFVAGLLYLAFWIDQNVGRIVLSPIVSAITAFSILVVSVNAFDRPYRLPEKLNKQDIEVTFLMGTGSLFLDKSSARYVNELKTIALGAGWKLGTTLIDLTGGSPGVTVILGGKMVGFPWLVGGYSGSMEFAINVLERVPKSELESAWVLCAPEGKRKISGEVLSRIGLIFPDDYVQVGMVKSGHRKENQILWMPN